jgi:hypothetical protein
MALEAAAELFRSALRISAAIRDRFVDLAKNVLGGIGKYAPLYAAIIPLWAIKERSFFPQAIAMKLMLKPAQKLMQKNLAAKQKAGGGGTETAADPAHH